MYKEIKNLVEGGISNSILRIEDNAFIPPNPYNSWILNEDTCLWEAPIPMPDDDYIYMWDEESISWQLVTID